MSSNILLLVAMLGFLGLGSSQAFCVGCPPPTIDGALDDMIGFAECLPSSQGCGLVTTDPEQDVCRIDPKFIGCVPFQTCPATGTLDYLPNGLDIVLAIAAYDRTTDILYLGIRVRAGQVIGDPDAGGTCNTDCGEGNIPDEPGIGGSQPYEWLLDTDCDGSVNITIAVSNNQVLVNDVVSPASSLSFLCNGADLEVSVPGLGLPAIWAFRAFTGSEADGFSEEITATTCCEIPAPDGACPRSAGFWKQQCLCDQGEGGRVKFSCDEMGAIAACIDGHSSFFDWADDFAGFCAMINPSTPVMQRKQAKRQFAALLASVCAGELAFPANNGDAVALPSSTPILDTCDGLAGASTVGELIDEVDDLLATLEPQPLTDASVKAAYGRIISCLDRINNGIGIPFDPEECVADGNSIAEAFANQGDSQTDVVPDLDAELFKPIPNPFTQNTRMAYSVSGRTSSQVEISIYNAAGQRVRTLVSGVQSAGRYETNWDGRNDRGAAVPAGVYFYRSVIEGESIVSRVVLMR